MMQYPVTHRLQSSQASMYNQVIMGENSQTTMLNISLFFMYLFIYLFIFFLEHNVLCNLLYWCYLDNGLKRPWWLPMPSGACASAIHPCIYLYIYIFFFLPLISSWRNLNSNTVIKLFLCICLYITTLLSLSYCWQYISKWMNWKCWHVNVYNHNAVLKILLAIY